MCGIAGVFNLTGRSLPPGIVPDDILATLRHRGPDDTGFFVKDGLFLGATRLAIIDPAGGRQPVADETGRFHLVMNGEIYDHDEKLALLAARGHHFQSRCDTEVAVHLFEESWQQALDSIDGQYAIAVHDAQKNKLLLARDRMGIAPLFYTLVGDYLVFASEMKAIFASGLVAPEIEPRGIDALLAFGCIPAPWTVFKGIRALPPGRYLEVSNGRISEHVYWDIPYPDAGEYARKPEVEWAAEFGERLKVAARRRLRADVPVGVFLSGGIDSGTIAALVADAPDIHERAFSISFPEPGYDESVRILRIARYLGFRAHLLTYTQRRLAEEFPRLIYHAETPLISTESTPLMALAGLASRHVKVILTGEGADEALGGYDYFRWEAFKQRFSNGLSGRAVLAIVRHRLRRVLGAENPFFPPAATEAWAQGVFGCYPAGMVQFFYWRRIREAVYSRDMLERQRDLSDAQFVDLPRERMKSWDPLNRSLYVASRIFLANHLLAAHSDRALMAHSVEGRYPFLDRSVQEFLAAVPPALKTCWRTEKCLLRRAMAGRLPREVLRRRKKPFLAPFGTPFIGPGAPEYAQELLSSRSLNQFGYFDARKVQGIIASLAGLRERLRSDSLRLDRDVVAGTFLGMSLVAVLSTQLLADQVRRGQFGGPSGRPASAAVTRPPGGQRLSSC